jgi:hypothetical protein
MPLSWRGVAVLLSSSLVGAAQLDFSKELDGLFVGSRAEPVGPSVPPLQCPNHQPNMEECPNMEEVVASPIIDASLAIFPDSPEYAETQCMYNKAVKSRYLVVDVLSNCTPIWPFWRHGGVEGEGGISSIHPCVHVHTYIVQFNIAVVGNQNPGWW